jgi:hypothetical protein
MFANNTDFVSENNAFMSKITVKEGDPLRYNQKLPVEFLKRYKNSRGLLLFQKMGAGKTRIGNAIADDFQQEGYKIIMISSKSLHENTKAEQLKYLQDVGRQNIDELIKKNYKFVSLNAGNMIHQVFKAVRQEGEELFSQVIESMFKTSHSPRHTKGKKVDVEEDGDGDGDGDDADEGTALRNIKKHIEKVNALINLDKCVVIMDEAHDFFNSVVNGSKNATALYYLLLHSKNSKIIFMSGSPIVNDPFEITVPINILGGVVDGETIFGENYETFYKYFISNPGIAQEDGEVKQSFLKNREKFIDRITGMISYFGADSPEFLELLPQPAPLTIRRVSMSDKQFSAYASARDREIEATLRKAGRRVTANPMTKPKGAGSTYRVMSRQISNVLYPESATTITKNAYGNMLIAKYLDKLEDSFFSAENLKLHSCKIYELLKDLSKCLPEGYLQFPGKSGTAENATKKSKKAKKVEKPTARTVPTVRGPGLVYSQFVESGVGVIARALTHYGFKEYSDVNRGDKSPKFAMMMGEVEFETRKKYEDIYNSDENHDGSLIAVLLVTVTAAQGINLFNCTNEFMLEPYWHLSRHDQFFARAVRPGSLSFLPKDKRLVGRYLYLADYPASPLLKEDIGLDVKKIKTIMETEKTTDVTLYAKAVLRKILINSVLSAAIDGSIDCYANYNNSKSVSCRVCKPTGRSLYARNLLTDMKNPSPCVPIVSAEVQAKKIEVNGTTYAYTLNPFKVFKHNKNTDSYQEITPADEEYYDVTKQIKK